MVHAGQVLARMETTELEAQLQAAKAQVKKAKSEKMMAEAQIATSISQRLFEQQEYQRTSTLERPGVGDGRKARRYLQQAEGSAGRV